jgi:Zn-finger nucleic acid-binding protein
MKCPLCKKEMVEEDFGTAKVDVCEIGCRGIWFDWSELEALDESDEGFGTALKEALEYPRTKDQNREQLQCPKCGIPMVVHTLGPTADINIDECFQCGGIFLDAGELKAIRDANINGREKSNYVQVLVDGIPDDLIDKERAKQTRENAIRKFMSCLRRYC